jgi:hypothetical protein
MSDEDVVAAAEARGLLLVVELCRGEPSWAWSSATDGGRHDRWTTRDGAMTYMRSALEQTAA